MTYFSNSVPEIYTTLKDYKPVIICVHCCQIPWYTYFHVKELFISPLFDLEDMSAFADDNYTIRFHKDLLIAQNQLQASITINKTCRLKIGMNIISNVSTTWMAKSISTGSISCIAPTNPIANAYFLPDESQHTLPRCSKEIIVTNFPKINKSWKTEKK